jgi:N,N'-diacetyllegionaminate synthase
LTQYSGILKMTPPWLNGRTSPLIIAEAGVNHNGDLGLAFELVDAAAESGADMVKFQTFSAAESVIKGAPTAEYQTANSGAVDQYQLLEGLELEMSAFADIADHCEKAGIEFLSTPFDKSTAEPLLKLGMRYIKVPSGELVNDISLQHFGSLGAPVILSTGMADLPEIRHAVNELRSSGSGEIILLHCTSLYPAPEDSLNLLAIETLRQEMNLPVGYSDHSEGIFASIAATALGAVVIEKHFTLDRHMEGPDHLASLEPDELGDLVTSVRATAIALGTGEKKPVELENDIASIVRRSWRTTRDLKAGDVVVAEDCCLKRPYDGLPPQKSPVGLRLLNDRLKDSPLRAEDFNT